MVASCIVGAALVTVVVYGALSARLAEQAPARAAGTRTVIAIPPPKTVHPGPHTPPQPHPMTAVDDFGFIETAARCRGAQTLRAIGRTARSLVVICADPDGNLEYHGLRLRDDAVLVAPATPAETAFVARNAQVTYTLTPEELVVTRGNAVIKREPVIEFHTAHPAADSSR